AGVAEALGELSDLVVGRTEGEFAGRFEDTELDAVEAGLLDRVELFEQGGGARQGGAHDALLHGCSFRAGSGDGPVIAHFPGGRNGPGEARSGDASPELGSGWLDLGVPAAVARRPG